MLCDMTGDDSNEAKARPQTHDPDHCRDGGHQESGRDAPDEEVNPGDVQVIRFYNTSQAQYSMLTDTAFTHTRWVASKKDIGVITR
ncbi:hypothetical protein [Methanogenium sp. MK-MG]|uniref:hypothetical protein n=1 Tax=Methanogenium sp. MK-MG TaxID=2599926 RepID=UPI0013EE2929|nr:hypothetical protein [Methanogenium sp. MK-MG]KAF1078651.1 hypothetical protein MKMG_00404 [Methanogenium sp. MK-MG]